MESALGWLGQIFNAILQFIPRIAIIRNTHQAVKWKRFQKISAVESGRLTIYWPLITDIEVIVVARQTTECGTQVITTSDGIQVCVTSLLVYWINDVIKAIGQKNWDVDGTVKELTQAVLVEEVLKLTYGELHKQLCSGKFTQSFTDNCKKQLDRFGVHVEAARLTDFAKIDGVFKLIGNRPEPLILE